MSRSSAPKRGWLAHYGELVAVWSKWTGNRQDAEDATQDVVVRALESDAGAWLNSRAYMHRSVHNRLVDGYRRSSVLHTVPLHELDEADHPLVQGPDAQAGAAELLAALKAALASLPLKCRQVFLLHRLEGYTQEEIAKKLGISVSMVEKHMIRASKHLRKELQNHAPH